MGKTHTEKIKEINQNLQEAEKRIERIEEQINNSKNAIDAITGNKERSERQVAEISAKKDQVTTASNEIEEIKEEINSIKEELNKKLNATEVKKEEFDKFFIKIFGEEDNQGNFSGGLKVRLDQKEKQLDKFHVSQEEDYKTLFKKIESLLPGAASAGLASAYSKQKDSYKNPGVLWALIFILSLTGVCATALLGFDGIKPTLKTLKDLEDFFIRSPFFFALIWLAKFSSKQYRQHKRLEQEYAHKEVLARSYQGYKKEFEAQKETETHKNEEILSGLHKVLIEAIASRS